MKKFAEWINFIVFAACAITGACVIIDEIGGFVGNCLVNFLFHDKEE